jgi:hypothetical protein
MSHSATGGGGQFSNNKSTKNLIICFLGIFVSYFFFGIIQEWM